jgi:hypothetical protein
VRRSNGFAALAALVVLHLAVTRPPESRAAQPAGDIQDTRERLARIYKRLGIERVEKKVERDDDDEGCCKRRREVRREERSSPTKWTTPAMPPFLGYLLVGLVLVAMLIPVYYALRSSFRDVPRVAAAPEEESAAAAAPASAGPWIVDLSECRRLIEAGKLAEGFAALHRLTLLALEKNRQLTLEETTTNWEYVRRLASKPALRAMLSGVTLAAEESVLGKRPPGREHYFALERGVLDGTRGEA